MNAHEFLKALTIVLCVAAVMTVLFQRMKLPVVLGYILAGLLIGPHIPIPLVADHDIVHTLSELGVILLMFSLGLEFSLRKLLQVGPTAAVTAIIQCSLLLWLGYLVGRALGWTDLESIFTGAVIAISSTTIIAKAFDEQNIGNPLREVVIGILIVEDLIAILLMAALTALSTGAGLTAGELGKTMGKLAGFLIGLTVLGLFTVPRAMRSIAKLKRPETTLVASVGLCFAVSLLAHAFGYSVALGAFLAGSLIAESGEEKTVEHLVQPVKDIFAAVFFVSVGMMIDPALIQEHWKAVLILTLVVVFGKIIGVSVGVFLTGGGTRSAIRAGMSLAQIGEFSFIIAGLGLSLNATGGFIYPVAVTVSAVTTLLTPMLIRSSSSVASVVDRRLPKSLQTFAALYGSWIENLRAPSKKPNGVSAVRRYFRLLLLDASILVAIVILSALYLGRMVGWTEQRLSLSPEPARVILLVGIFVACTPFAVGAVRTSRGLGAALAERALPPTAEGRVDLAAAPRKMFVVTLQLAGVLAVGVPILAITQPFLPGVPGALILVLLLAVLSFGFWKSANNLQGHVRAGAQAIVEALAAQSQAGQPAVAGGPSSQTEPPLAELHQLLPGIGEPVPVRIRPAGPGIGKSLAELNLRGMTGATVLAIRRGQEDVIVPTAREVLREGDILALAGTHEAIEAARELLLGAATPVSSG